MRSGLILVILLLQASAVANIVWLGSELRRFVREVPKIASTRELQRFQRVVARQMYGTLAQIVLIGTPFLVFWYGIFSGTMVPEDLIFVVLPGLVIISVALAFRPVEQAAKRIPSASDELERRRVAIVTTWMKKPLPDW